MPTSNLETSLDQRYSSEGATPTPWSEADRRLTDAEIYWISTVRPDSRPHVTPMIAIWDDGALVFCTGNHERKALNLAQNAHCVVTTGCNTYDSGLDLVIEGDAIPVNDDARLNAVAALYKSKYDWVFTVRNGSFVGEPGNVATV